MGLEGTWAHTVPLGALAFATPVHKHARSGREPTTATAAVQKRHITTLTFIIISSTEGALFHQWEDTNTAYGVPMIDEKRTELGHIPTQYRSDPSRDVTNTTEIPSESPSGLHTRTPTPSQLSTPRPRQLNAALRRYPAPACGDDNNGDGNHAASGECLVVGSV